MTNIAEFKTHAFSVALAALLMLGACAHQPSPSAGPAPAAAAQPAAATQVAADTPRTVMDDGVAYRIVKTPFGMAKQALAGQAAAEPAGASDRIVPPDSAPALAETGSGPVLSVGKKELRMEAPAPKGQSGGQGGVTFNFDDADLYEVIRAMAEVLNLNYIVDPTVKGRVTIHTAGTLDRKDLFPLFFQILEANGLTAVQEGPVYKITSLKDAPRLPMTARYGQDYRDLPPGERIVMQIIPLKHISGTEMVKVLTPFVSADGTIVAHDETNTLVLVDKGTNVLKALYLVETFDADLFDKVAHRFFKIQNNDAEDFAKTITELLAAYQDKSTKDVKIIPIKHLNSLLVIGATARMFEKIAEFIAALDTVNETAQPQLYIYAVKNGRADELSELLGTIFSITTAGTDKETSGKTTTDAGAASKDGGQTVSAANPFAKKAVKTEPSRPKSGGGVGADLATGTLRGEARITADAIRNALIIEAIAADYQVILKVLERLDVMPRQVLIEALIAEITLDDSTKYGVEWSYARGDGGRLITNLLSGSMGSSGMNFIIGQTNRWTATLSALASESKVNILSAPTVLASNDSKASINISTEVPVASAQYQYGGSTSESVVTTNIEYRNTGIILEVTPHINENGMVSMEISQEVSEVAGDVTVAGESYPSFFERSVNTTLTVGHQQTIVIGGLIRENKSTGLSGVPALSKVPLFGALFGTNSRTNAKSELIILITPRVIVNLSDVEAVTREFKARVPGVSVNSAHIQ